MSSPDLGLENPNTGPFVVMQKPPLPETRPEGFIGHMLRPLGILLDRTLEQIPTYAVGQMKGRGDKEVFVALFTGLWREETAVGLAEHANANPSRFTKADLGNVAVHTEVDP